MSTTNKKTMGMVGKKHSTATKTQISKTQKKRWAKFYAENPDIQRRDRRQRAGAEYNE